MHAIHLYGCIKCLTVFLCIWYGCAGCVKVVKRLVSLLCDLPVSNSVPPRRLLTPERLAARGSPSFALQLLQSARRTRSLRFPRRRSRRADDDQLTDAAKPTPQTPLPSQYMPIPFRYVHRGERTLKYALRSTNGSRKRRIQTAFLEVLRYTKALFPCYYGSTISYTPSVTSMLHTDAICYSTYESTTIQQVGANTWNIRHTVPCEW